MTSQIAIEVLKLLSPLLVATVTWVATRVSRLITARVRNEHLRGVLLRLDDVVVSVVKELQQVTVESLKAASLAGKLPAGAAETVKQSAISAVRAQLGPAGLADLASTLGLSGDAVEKLLSTKVEAAVYGIRHATTSNGAHAPGTFVPFTP